MSFDEHSPQQQHQQLKSSNGNGNDKPGVRCHHIPDNDSSDEKMFEYGERGEGNGESVEEEGKAKLKGKEGWDQSDEFETAAALMNLSGSHNALPAPDAASESESDEEPLAMMRKRKAGAAKLESGRVAKTPRQVRVGARPEETNAIYAEHEGHDYVLQQQKCLTHVFRKANRHCNQCIGRQSGYTCAFVGFRWFRIKSRTCWNIGPNTEVRFLNNPTEDETPIFPDEFNEPFEKEHAEILKTAAASHLVETLEKELRHAKRPNAAKARIDLNVRSTCDTCLVGILNGSWFCTKCARDMCFDCHELLGQSLSASTSTSALASTSTSALASTSTSQPSPPLLASSSSYPTPTPSPETFNSGGYSNCTTQAPQPTPPPPPLEAVQDITNGHRHRLQRCVKPRFGPPSPHTFQDFVPLTRSHPADLEEVVEEMKAWLKDHPTDRLEGAELDEEEVKKLYEARNASGELECSSEESNRFLRVEHATITPTPTPLSPAPSSSLQDGDGGEVTVDVKQYDYFRLLWRKGETIVVERDWTSSLHLDWTPEAFCREYGDQECTILNSDGSIDPNREHTVRRFFETFGVPREQAESIKIKDWPPKADFKIEYPELYEDYQNALPSPAVTRRDGVLNIAAHTPINANPPDLGPKGYYSQICQDGPGGQGSTKLHTVNRMIWASDLPNGEPGCAAWDIYRAEDADKIRDFLYGLLGKQKGWDRARAKAELNDPIHTQNFFLNSRLRKQLFEETGVKSWRIWQFPGQVVYIPAGCPHQVCNFADCIKLASDFVSIENVKRCWKITDDFRAMTKDRQLWRSDILGLKAQLLWAWHSCKRLDEGEEKLEAGEGQGGGEKEQERPEAEIDEAKMQTALPVGGEEKAELHNNVDQMQAVKEEEAETNEILKKS